MSPKRVCSKRNADDGVSVGLLDGEVDGILLGSLVGE